MPSETSLLLLQIIVFSLSFRAAKALHRFGNDLDGIQERIVESLLPTSADAVQSSTKQVQKYASSLMTDGSWPDIDYKDKTRGAWKTMDHVDRVKTMCIVHKTPNSSMYNDTGLMSKIHLALDYWLKNDFQNPNWWYNQIGVPLGIANSYLLTAGSLTESESKKGVEIMERATWWKGWTGANLVWMCNIQIQRGLYTGNETAVNQCFTRIYDEVFIGTQQQDGIQTDGSFHQHGPELLAGSYGSIFTSQLLDYVYYSAGTTYAMNSTTLTTFGHLVLDGQQWMIRGDTWDWSVTGRGVSGGGGGKPGTFSSERLSGVPGERHQEFIDFATRLSNGHGPPYVSGNRHYWDSDYMVHRRPNYMITLHMRSNRTIGARCVNEQGKKSEHFADGVINIYYTGSEYEEIFPVWDWQRLPGISCEQIVPLLPCDYSFDVKMSNFVGGVSNKQYGVAAMDLTARNLTAKKSWFFFENGFAALLNNMSCPSGNPVYTSVANRLLNGDVYVAESTSFFAGGNPRKLALGNYTFTDLAFVHHDSTGYILMTDKAIHVNVGPRTGDWASIGTGTGKVTRDVFDMWIDHGSIKKPESSGYIAIVDVDLESFASYVKSGNDFLRVISTGQSPAQGVFNTSSGIFQGVFWEPGNADVTANLTVSVNSPVLLMIAPVEGALNRVTTHLSVSVSSPVIPASGSVNIQINPLNLHCQHPALIQLTGTGSGTDINVMLPSDPGKTVTFECSS